MNSVWKILEMLKLIIKHDFKRYKSKGLWLLVGIWVFIYFIVYFPTFAVYFIPTIKKYFEEDMYFLLFLHNFMYISMSFVLYIFYHFDLCREHKANLNPWPWEENKDKNSSQEWNKLLKNSMKCLFLNMFIISPILTVLLKNYARLNYSTKVEEIK